MTSEELTRYAKHRVFVPDPLLISVGMLRCSNTVQSSAILASGRVGSGQTG
jgi:hypothetical protein